MEDYKKLAVRYLTMNKMRSLITIIGTSITVMVLFCMLNLSYSWILQFREQMREDMDCNFVLLTETEEQIQQVLADDRVKNASIGPYYYHRYGEETMYDQAVYVDVYNPWFQNHIFDSMCMEYELKGVMNDELAWTYLQGSEGSMLVVLILGVLLITYIFAIFGVGMIRNTIQINILERIKDFGNLRCIGASKSQLKAVIFLQGAILEVIGITAGSMIGTVVSVIVGAVLHMAAGFHILPVILITIAFTFDLFFAMRENCKLVTRMTPVSAIRGEYRIKKEKVRARKTSIFAKLFGIDGDYAYKNIRRNPERFRRTVFGLGISLGLMTMVVYFGVDSLKNIHKSLEKYRYFQEFYMVMQGPWVDPNLVYGVLPSQEILETLREMPQTEEVKQLYGTDVYLADVSAMYDHYTEDYMQCNYADLFLSDWDASQEMNYMLLDKRGSVPVYGYDETDYARYASALEAGTLELSDHGILLINSCDAYYDDEDTYMGTTRHVKITDYQVGDTIDFIDPQVLRNRCAKDIEAIVAERDETMKTLGEQYNFNELNDFYMEEKNEIEQEANLKMKKAVYENCMALAEEGCFTTYTIEGILNKDVNLIANEYTDSQARFILPMELYVDLTGYTSDQASGLGYHFKHHPNGQRLFMLVVDAWNYDGTYMVHTSDYAGQLMMLQSGLGAIVAAALVVTFLFVMTVLNIINTTQSSLYLRRKEFAQLRVIGVSKKRLTKMVVLEGVITSIYASVISVVIGIGASALIAIPVKYMYFVTVKPPVFALLLMIVLVAVISCGSVILPVKGLTNDLADDLKESGDQ